MSHFFGLDPTEWMAIASVVNAVTVVVLAIITAWYAFSAKRQANAAENQAKAATVQAEAAKSQSLAAHSQATAALETIAALREETFNQRATARQVVLHSIQTAISNIEYWEGQGTLESRAQQRAFPQTIALLPSNQSYALDSARMLSHDLASQLNTAFNILGRATSHIESMRVTQQDQLNMQLVTRQSGETRELLAEAKALIQKCQTLAYTDSFK